MAGTQIMPISAFPVSSFVFPNFHVGAGANSKQDEGLGVTDATTLTADAIWRLRFKVPKTLPSGTCTLMLDSLANATTGVLKWNPKWATVAASASPSGATLTAEGTQTITWAAGNNDQYLHSEVTLDANTVTAGTTIVMDLTFEDTSTTLAVVSTHQVWIEWI